MISFYIYIDIREVRESKGTYFFRRSKSHNQTSKSQYFLIFHKHKNMSKLISKLSKLLFNNQN